MTKNGTVTARYQRLPGGLVFSRSADGRSASFLTYDALGRAVFAEDSAGNKTLATGVPITGGGGAELRALLRDDAAEGVALLGHTKARSRPTS